MVKTSGRVEHHARLKALFFQAVELDGVDRRRFVEESCLDDIELLTDLESLLLHHESSLVPGDPGAREP